MRFNLQLLPLGGGLYLFYFEMPSRHYGVPWPET